MICQDKKIKIFFKNVLTYQKMCDTMILQDKNADKHDISYQTIQVEGEGEREMEKIIKAASTTAIYKC